MQFFSIATFVEFLRCRNKSRQKYGGSTCGNGRHQEQNGQQRIIPKRERAAYAQQAACVDCHQNAENHADNFQPGWIRLANPIEDGNYQRHDGEHSQENNAPGHYGAEVCQQQRKTQRAVETGLCVHHKQA